MLMSRSIRNLSVIYGGQRLAKWPGLLSSFQALSRLSLRAIQQNSLCFVEGVDMEMVPRSVEEIELQTLNGFASFFSSIVPGRVPTPEELLLRFPKLTSLTLSSLDIKSLPTRVDLGEHRSALCRLPLLSLRLQHIPYPSDELYALPRSLTILELSIAPEAQDWANARLPPRLTYLSLSGVNTFRFITKVPETLVSLSVLFEPLVKTDIDRFWTWIRPSLKHLSLSSCPPLDTATAQLLPRSLLSLLISPTLISSDALSFLPPTLERCRISPLSLSSCPNVHVSELPRTLKELPTLFDVRPEHWQHLPPALRYFSTGPEEVPFSAFDHLRSLPESLQALKIYIGEASALRWIGCTRLTSLALETRFPLLEVQFMPLSRLPSLTFLSLSGSFDPAGLSLLSCSLRELSAMRCAINPQNFDFSKKWASKLYTLSIAGAFNAPFKKTKDWISALPNSLRTLRLEVELCGKGPKPIALTMLPPKLRWLSMTLDSLAEEDLCKLPKKLTRLSLSTDSVTDISDLHKLHRHLPLELVHVNLKNAAIPTLAHISHVKVLLNLTPIVAARMDLQTFHMKTPTANLAFVELIAENKRRVLAKTTESYLKVPTMLNNPLSSASSSSSSGSKSTNHTVLQTANHPYSPRNITPTMRVDTNNLPPYSIYSQQTM